MSQANLVIEDGTGEEVLNRISAALSSLGSCFYGATDPATNGYAISGMWWADSANKLIKQRNAANDTWVTKGTLLDDGTIKWGAAASADTAENSLSLDGHEVGVGVGNIPVLVDKGNGEAALPAVDGSQLTGIAAGALPLPNHIVKGGKVASVSGLTMTHDFIEALINRKKTYKAAGDTQTLPAKRLGLFTLDKDGNRGTALAADPTTFIDNNTVGMWKPDGSASNPNLAVGVSSSAVANNLVKTGTVSPVDGVFGGDAAKSDGSTGSFSLSNATGLPTGANPFTIHKLTTFHATTGNRCSVSFGTYASSSWIGLGVNGGNLQVMKYGTNYDTSFSIEQDKLYLVSLAYDGTVVYIYINGILVYQLTITLSISHASLPQFLAGAGITNGFETLHFIEIKKVACSAQQIAEMATNLCVPVCWTDAATGKRKNLTAILPAGTISLGMFRTGATGILGYDDYSWQWARREGAYGGNRIVLQDYKVVVTASPLSMLWQPPFGYGAVWSVAWRSAENSNGLNEVPAKEGYTESNSSLSGIMTTPYKNGKVGAYCGGNGPAYVNGAWRTGGYVRPVFTLQETDEEVPDVA